MSPRARPTAAETVAHRDLGGGALLLALPSRALPLVSVAVSFRSGSAIDPPGTEGLARITTRLLRRGSKGLTGTETENAIDRLGAELSAEVTPSTTSLYGQVISRNAGAFVELLARILGTPTFPEDELARLLRETRAEIVEARDNDRALADRFFRRALFAGHGYGRSIRGSTQSLGRIDVAGVRRHHAATFVRGNLVVAISGDVDLDEAERFGKTLAGALPEGPAAGDTLGEPPPVENRRLVFVDKPERTQTQILIGSLGTSPHDEDHAALSVANSIFGGTFTSRLTREVRGKRGWSYGASSRLGVERHRHSFVMWTFPAATDAAPCITLELDLLRKLVDEGVTPRELSFIKRYLTRSWAFEIDTAHKRVGHELDVALLGLPGDYYSGWLDKVAAITVEDANAALKRRLSPGNLLVTVVGTAKDILDGVRASIGDLAETEVFPFDQE